MKLSARNQIKGKVADIKEGVAAAKVTIDVEGNTITSTISVEALKDLGIEVGSEVTAVAKASSVILLAGETDAKLSARNQIQGTVVDVKEGAVVAKVTVDAGSYTITSTISMEALSELEIKVGSKVTAIIKASSVMLMA